MNLLTLFHGDVVEWLDDQGDGSVDLVIADPLYGEHKVINAAIKESRRISAGASLFFMYAEDLCFLDEVPDQILFWLKQPSTKNTVKKYSRFVEVIAAYDIQRGPYNRQHWSAHTGVFQDGLIEPKVHEFQKPRSLMEKLIRIHSNPGDKVADLFAGSGTTSRVAVGLGRNAIAVERDMDLISALSESADFQT